MYQLRIASVLVWPWLLVAVAAVGDEGPWSEPQLFQPPPANATRQLEQSASSSNVAPQVGVARDFQSSRFDQQRAVGVHHASGTAPSDPLRSPVASQQYPTAVALNNPTPAASPKPTQKPPLLLSHTDQPKPLAPADKSKAPSETPPTTIKGIDTLLTVLGSLGVVVGLFLVTMWCFRRGMPKSSRALPAEVVEVLGRAPLTGRQQMHVIRFGSKLVLAAVSPNGVDSISEITDPSEVDRLAGHCQTTSPFSSTGAFRSLLDRLDDRSSPAADEEPRRPNRGRSPFLARRNQREEGEHV